MDGDGLHVNTAQLITAAEAFQAASNETQQRVAAMEAELSPYAKNPERFQGPVADKFRKIYQEIADDLLMIKQETQTMSTLVDTAKTQYMKSVTIATGNLPNSVSGGTDLGSGVFHGLTGR
jgi:uncharacterized protein YukE